MDNDKNIENLAMEAFRAWLDWQLGDGDEEEFNASVDAVADAIDDDG
jgi:hypothetical protein